MSENQPIQQQNQIKQKPHIVLSIYSKHITGIHIQLKQDIEKMCPHTKNELKLTPEIPLSALSGIAKKRSCDTLIFYETKQHGKVPDGPTIKIQLDDIQTSKSMKFTGNFALNSRPVLIFDKQLNKTTSGKILARLFQQVFQIPDNYYNKTPFIDHAIVIGQISEDTFQFSTINKNQEFTGPCFKFQLCTIYDSCMSGNEIYRSSIFMSLKDMRDEKREEGIKKQEKRQKEKEWRDNTWNREYRGIDEIDKLFYSE